MITFATITGDPFTREILAHVDGVHDAHTFEVSRGRFLVWCVASSHTLDAWRLTERCEQALRDAEEWERRLADVEI